MPAWLNTVIQCSCAKERGSKLVLVSVEAFISVLESRSEDKNLK